MSNVTTQEENIGSSAQILIVGNRPDALELLRGFG